MVKHDFYVLTAPSRPQFGYIDQDPKGATKTFLVGEGRSFKGHLPSEAAIALDAKHKEIKLEDFIANSLSWLIVSEKARVLLGAEPNPCEVYPLKVLDPKGRPIKTPYFLIHPVGTVDCVDLAKSEYDRSSMEPAMILGFQRVVLHQRKIPPDRTLFRLKENPRTYIIRSDLLDKLKVAGVKGIQLLGLDTPVFI